MTETKKTPQRDTDILIIGGGPAGIQASQNAQNVHAPNGT